MNQDFQLNKKSIISNYKRVYSEKDIISYFLGRTNSKIEEVRSSLSTGKTELALMKFGEVYSAFSDLKDVIEIISGDIEKENKQGETNG